VRAGRFGAGLRGVFREVLGEIKAAESGGGRDGGDSERLTQLHLTFNTRLRIHGL
jgi:hypothetical protein